MGKLPGAADDDDLIVELEETQDDFAPASDREEVAEAVQPKLTSSTLPDGDEDDADAGDELSAAPAARTRGQAEVEDIDAGDSETYARLTAAEERVRQAEAGAIWQQANFAAREIENQRNSIKVGQDTLKARIEMAERELNIAEANEDRAAARNIERSIKEMEDLNRELTAANNQLGDPQAIIEQGRQRAQAALDTQTGGKKVGTGIQARHPLAERWASVNGWMKTNRAANQSVIQFSNALTRDGWDPNSPGFYAELSRRLQVSYPTLKVAQLQAQKRGPGKAQVRSPVAPGRSSAGSAVTKNAAGKRVYRMTGAEQKAMSNMRLDPKNPVHQKAWAKSRLETAARERSQQ